MSDRLNQPHDRADDSTLLDILEAARDALTDDLPANVLRKLVEAWNILRSPHIADVIDLASQACRPGQADLVGGQQIHATEWNRVAEANDPADLDRLIESLVLREAEKSAARVSLLRKRTPNPRLTHLLTQHVSRRSFHGTRDGRIFWRAIEYLLLELADSRIKDGRFAPPGTAEPRFKSAMRWVHPPRALSSDEAIALAEIRTHFTGRAVRGETTKQDGASLLTSVYENPADDGPRVVYADWLIEQKDARGEFITLQLERRHARHGDKLPRALAARERALLDQHAKAWLGRVANWVKKGGYRFERGFLAWARPHVDAGNINAPEWNTCREIDLSSAPWTFDGALYVLAAASELRGIEALTGMRAELLGRLASGKSSAGKSFTTRQLLMRLRRIEVLPGNLAHASIAELDMPALREIVWRDQGMPTTLFGAVSTGKLAAHLDRLEYLDEKTKLVIALERDERTKLLTRVRVISPILDATQARASLETMCNALGLELSS